MGQGAHSMSDKPKDKDSGDDKAAVTLPGVVEAVIPAVNPSEPDKAQISVQNAEELYREIRIDNTLQDQPGNTVELKEGAQVEVTIEADKDSTTPTIKKKQSA
jgi:ABC-type phosphate transport system substrate-binding protein